MRGGSARTSEMEGDCKLRNDARRRGDDLKFVRKASKGTPAIVLHAAGEGGNEHTFLENL